MRIAFVSTILTYPWGGADVLWTRTAAAALRRGDRVLVATNRLAVRHARVAALAVQGAELHERSGFTQERGQRERWRRAIARRLGLRTSLTAALDRFKPDALVLCQGGVFDFLIEDELRRWIEQQGIPVVAVCQSFDPHEQISTAQRVTATAFVARCRAFVFVSTQNRDAAIATLGVQIPQAIVVPNPIELTGALPLSWPSENDNRLAVVARLEEEKGLDLLVRAIAALPAVDRPSVDIYGRGPSEPQLRELTADTGVADCIAFKGYASDIKQIWSDHLALVLPSRREGCSLAMLEALACGRPVIAADVGGVRDWVQEGRTGYICESDNVAALAGMITRALAESSRWREMGAAAAAFMKAAHPAFPEMAVLQSCTR